MTPSLVCEGPMATLTFHRPAQANRLGLDDLEVLNGHLASIDADRELRVLVLRSDGPTFCSGFNLDDWSHTVGSTTPPQRFAQVVDRLALIRPVTVAALQGGCYGGGVDVAMACDLRVGTRAVHIAVPAVRLGLQFYRTGFERALSRLPWPLVQRLFLLGERLDHATLQAAGWFHREAEGAEQLPQAVDATVAHLLGLAPLALEGVKHALARAGRGQWFSALDAQHIDALGANTEASADLQEGISAWLEGRSPQFQGR